MPDVLCVCVSGKAAKIYWPQTDHYIVKLTTRHILSFLLCTYMNKRIIFLQGKNAATIRKAKKFSNHFSDKIIILENGKLSLKGYSIYFI